VLDKHLKREKARTVDVRPHREDKKRQPTNRSSLSVTALPSTRACFALYVSSEYLHLTVYNYRSHAILMELQAATGKQEAAQIKSRDN
jgi:hypothetical protein